MTHYPRGEETRQVILTTALALFSQDGYDATSVAEICHQSDVSKGAFYHHFQSKQELFLALMTDWLAGVDGLLQSADATAGEIPAAIESMAVRSSQIFKDLEGGFPILLEFWRQAIRKPAVWQRAVAPYRRYLDFFTRMVETGIQQGDFVNSLEPGDTARLLMAIAMGLLLQASFDPQGTNWQSVTLSGVKTILDGMRRIE